MVGGVVGRDSWMYPKGRDSWMCPSTREARRVMGDVRRDGSNWCRERDADDGVDARDDVDDDDDHDDDGEEDADGAAIVPDDDDDEDARASWDEGGGEGARARWGRRGVHVGGWTRDVRARGSDEWV